MSKEYLIKQNFTKFYDPHGIPDSGGEWLEVVYKKDYLNFKKEKAYIELEYAYGHYEEDLKESNIPIAYFDEDTPCMLMEDNETKYCGYDGYNCEIEFFKLYPCTLEQKDIIENHNKLLEQLDA